MKTLTLKDRLKPEHLKTMNGFKNDYPEMYDKLNKVLENETSWSTIRVGDSIDLQMFFNLNQDDGLTGIINLFDKIKR